MRRSILALALLSSCVVATPATAGTPLLPVDEASQDPSFLAFRNELTDIVERQDAPALLARVDPQIEYSFGETNGIDGFTAAWNLQSDPANSELWPELREVLSLGGSFQDQYFVAPYVTAEWPEALDAFEHVAIIGSNVRVRQEPAPTSPVIGAASHEVLRLGQNAFSSAGWVAVILDDGRAGYVSERYARTAVDYRAFFVRIDGAWKMQVFIAGD